MSSWRICSASNCNWSSLSFLTCSGLSTMSRYRFIYEEGRTGVMECSSHGAMTADWKHYSTDPKLQYSVVETARFQIREVYSASETSARFTGLSARSPAAVVY